MKLFFPIIAMTFLFCLGMDWLVSVQLQWHTTFHLYELNFGPQPTSEEKQRTALLLMLLVYLMYFMMGLALARAEQLWGRLTALTQLNSATLKGLEQLTRELFTQTPPDTVGGRSIAHARFDKLSGAVQDLNVPMPLAQWLRLQGPRTLTDFESFSDGLRSCLEYGLGDCFQLAQKLNALGNLAALLGLSSTCLGLVAAGNDLNNPTMVGATISAALLKTFCGFLVKVICVLMVSAFEQRAEAFAHALQGAIVTGMLEKPRAVRRTSPVVQATLEDEYEDEEEEQEAPVHSVVRQSPKATERRRRNV